MKLQDIKRRHRQQRSGKNAPRLRALVNPHSTFKTASPGMLIVALNRLCAALNGDPAAMPPATCGALDLPPDSTYSEGSAQAKRDGARLARHFMAG